MTPAWARRTVIAAVGGWILAACAAEAPWVTRSDLIEVVLLADAVSVDVTVNDTIPANARLTSIGPTTSDLDVIADASGVVTARSVGGAAGDEHFLTYQVSGDNRVTEGTLIVRIVEGPSPNRKLVVDRREVDFGTISPSSVGSESIGVSVIGTGAEAYSIDIDPADRIEYSIDLGTCDALTERQPCVLTVEWSPTEPGDLDEIVEIRADGVGSVTVRLTGTASRTAFELSPESIDFETAIVDEDPPRRDVTIHNTGSASINPEIRSRPQGVSLDFDECNTVAAGAECRFVISLETEQAISVVGALVVGVAGGGTASIDLAGRVLDPPPEASFELSPGVLTISDRVGRRTIVIENKGGSTLTNFRTSGLSDWLRSEFATDCESLVAQGSCELTLAYERNDRDSTDDFTVSVESGSVTRTIGIAVESLTRSIELDPPAIVLTRTNVVETIVVTNTGDVPLSSVSLPGSSRSVIFRDESCGSTLEPRDRCEFQVSPGPAVLRQPTFDSLTSHDVSAIGVFETLSVTIDLDPPPDFELDPDGIILPDNGLSGTVELRNTGGETLDAVRFAGLAGFGPNGDGILSVTKNSCVDPIRPGEECAFDLLLDVYPSGGPPSIDVEVISNGVRQVIRVQLFQID